MRTIVILSMIFISTGVTYSDGTAVAQEVTSPKLYPVVYPRFKPAKADRARKIIRRPMWATDEKVKRQIIAFDFDTGPWHHVVYIPIAMSSSGFDTVPPRSEWFAALDTSLGGRAAAQTLLAEFLDTMEASETEIARLSKSLLAAPAAE